MSKLIVIGRFGTPHGVRGDIRVQSFTDPASNLLNYQPWQIEVDGELTTVTITRTKPYKDHFIAHIKGIEDRDIVRKYTNIDILIDRDKLPPITEDEVYWQDLIGLSVIDQHGQYLGKVDHLFPTGSNDVIVVKGDNKEQLLPYIDEVVLNIDLKKQKMDVNWEEPE